ncbi:MAG: LysM peptidoglycan-binding domain-containing protein [Clostridia bacterium]|nr:LysM peptidoglycan-binding domain-containing protein [Clostridia bacterium]
MLKIDGRKYHKVSRGETIKKIAEAYCVGEYAIVRENGLTGEVETGQILRLPKERGNCYMVQAGDTKSVLCGSEERYEKINGPYLFPGMRVRL